MTQHPRFRSFTFPALALAASLGVLSFGGLGCSDSKPPAKTEGDDASNANGKNANGKGDKDKKSDSAISIDDKIVKLCGDLPTSHFDFDSSQVQPDAKQALDALAQCFVSGAGKGKSIVLTGGTDNIGPVEYNVNLGGRRAGSVADYLATKGMEKTRLKTNSVGEFGATGSDDTGRAKDRKVDITLFE
jgi:peptidoglycan-associated lipoprotein